MSEHTTVQVKICQASSSSVLVNTDIVLAEPSSDSKRKCELLEMIGIKDQVCGNARRAILTCGEAPAKRARGECSGAREEHHSNCFSGMELRSWVLQKNAP